MVLIVTAKVYVWFSAAGMSPESGVVNSASQRAWRDSR